MSDEATYSARLESAPSTSHVNLKQDEDHLRSEGKIERVSRRVCTSVCAVLGKTVTRKKENIQIYSEIWFLRNRD